MSELRDRLERLATRGTRRGADDVLRDAQRGAHTAASVAPDADGTDLEIVDDDLPFVSLEPVASRRGRFGSLVAAAGVAALVGVGALAVTAIFGSGGAGSPEGAVRQLADAITHKDPLAAVDVLVPTEVRSMRQTVKHVTQRAADLKIVDDASQPLAGVDLSVDHLQLSTENLADGYAKVTVTSGELSASTHAAAMSKLLQNTFRNSDTTDSKNKVDLARLASGSDLPTFVVTVRHDGGWYVSPAYTALEYAREAADGPAATFGSAQAAANLGADSPDAAVSDALHAWQTSDWDRLMALAPPDELPIYDYRAWIDQQAADIHPDFTIDKVSTSATVSGDTAIVKLEASGSTGTGSDQGTWQVGGSCPQVGTFESKSATATSDGGRTSADSAVSSTTLCLAGDLGGAVPFGLRVGAEGNAPATGPVSIEVVRENGRWFVSPVSTALDVIDATIQHIDERSLYPVIGLGYLLPPDATITLDQPFSPAQFPNGAHVYAFDGTAGQTVIGESDGSSYYFGGDLYTADGREIGFVDFQPKQGGYGGSTAKLPSTGSYRLVVTQGVPKGTTLTLWDTAHAPKALLNPPNGPNYPSSTCTHTLAGKSCASIATPTTAPLDQYSPTLPPPPPAQCHRTAGGGTACIYESKPVGVATTSIP